MAAYEPNINPAVVNLAKNGTRDMVAAPGAGLAIWVYYINGTTDAAGTVSFLDSTPTTHTGVMPLAATKTLVLGSSTAINWRAPIIKCAVNTKLQATLSVNSDFDGIVQYAIIDAAHGAA